MPGRGSRSGIAAGPQRVEQGGGHAHGNGPAVDVDGHRFAFGPGQGPGTADESVLASPMAGNLVKWVADDGAQLAEGDPVAVLEAMKMETTVRAHRAGTFARAALEPGTAVARQDSLGSIGA